MELVRKGVMAHVYRALLGFCRDGMKQLMRGVWEASGGREMGLRGWLGDPLL